MIEFVAKKNKNEVSFAAAVGKSFFPFEVLFKAVRDVVSTKRRISPLSLSSCLSSVYLGLF